MQRFDAIIIGAGMSGLAAGIRLAMFGKRVAILEKHAKLGGLNSYYKKGGYELDVGLHAVTNFAPKHEKRRPLSRLLRQLRLSHDDFALAEHQASEIRFPNACIRFRNGLESFRHGILAAFPAQAEPFDRLCRLIAERSALALETTPREFISARAVLRDCGLDPLLVEMLLNPVQYYGSAHEHDIDLDQFVIMFEALFIEGLSRPREGVRRIIRLLETTFKSHGGELHVARGVAKIHVDPTTMRVASVETEAGQHLTADVVISSIGLVETECLRTDTSPALAAELRAQLGRLSFVESMAVLDVQPKALGIDTAITFFCTTETFQYRRPDDFVDTTSGVICCPSNYDYDPPDPLPPGMVRVTAQANFERWRAVVPQLHRYWKNENYLRLKAEVLPALLDRAAEVMAVDFRPHITFTDVFTPLTVARYTFHPTGAVYGTPTKRRDGRTTAHNLFLCGTDQGFLGITGALLSGITIANLHVLRSS